MQSVIFFAERITGMTNKAMALTQRQVKALCLGAAQAGFVAEILINGAFIRLVPQDAPPSMVYKTPEQLREEELDDELERFKRKHGYS
ncbi:hypothetical protein AWN88_21645 [Agrobacterium tumefaciens]|nr:hypothetical protein AWN88_21645 [Agrobacterium tumefaciens]KAJ37086.1 hypothetical protein BW45_09740 [Agrobacterium tumefaciens]